MLTFFKALPACLVGMEACASAHYWARELTQLGHQMRLMPVRGLDRACAAAGFDRRQTEARADLETRRPISETHSGGRSPCGVEAGAPPTGEVSVGHTTSRTQTVQGRGSGGCQQDGARCLGVVGQGRQLSGACACGSGVKSLATAELICVCAHMDCRGDDDVDAKRSRPSIGKTREGPRDT